jgi:hypothetical protein
LSGPLCSAIELFTHIKAGETGLEPASSSFGNKVHIQLCYSPLSIPLDYIKAFLAPNSLQVFRQHLSYAPSLQSQL